jgi:ABC-type antimicrobial peptide transport system permease subunit
MERPVFLVRAANTAAGTSALTRYERQFPDVAYLAAKPTNLVNFGEAVNFPLILGVVLVVFGLATLLHVLVVSVARRRRELGLFRAIGLVRHQIVAVVCWQSTAIACVGLAVGLPVGLLAGRAIWQAFAVDIGVVPVTVLEPVSLALLAAGVLVAANVLAIGPALVSARTNASALLRSE